MTFQNKIKVMQQVLAPQSKGGVSSEFGALKQSSLNEKYQFIPLILEKGKHGINLHDILFYYRGIKREKPDIIHVRGASVDGLNAEIAAKLAGNVKILLCIHGMYSDFVYYNPIKKWIAKNVIEPISFYLADGISCVYKSCEERDNFQRYKNKIVPFVYNRIPQFFDCVNERGRKYVRKQIGINTDAIVGIFCGRVSREKGLEYFVKALISIEEKIDENMSFIIVGDGDYLKEFKEKIEEYPKLKENVYFLGTRSDIKTMLSASDYFIMPSLHENHSIALLEAMALNLPAIATDVGGNKETVKDGKFGIIIPPYDEKSLAQAILDMNKNELRNEYKENIQTYPFEEFSDVNVDLQLDSAYKAIINKK